MNIDSELPSPQKATLLEISARDETLHNAQVDAYSRKVEDDLTGILHLIDALQDDAVKNGTPEEEVFQPLLDTKVSSKNRQREPNIKTKE
jgi:hypothetical protein